MLEGRGKKKKKKPSWNLVKWWTSGKRDLTTLGFIYLSLSR